MDSVEIPCFHSLETGYLHKMGQHGNILENFCILTFLANSTRILIYSKSMQNLIAHFPGDGTSVDIQPLLFKFSLDTTIAFLFGQSAYSLNNMGSGEGSWFAKNFDTAQDYVVKRFRLLDLYWLIGGRKFFDACDAVHDFVDKIIQQRQVKSTVTQEDTDRFVFFDAVAQDARSPEALRGQLLNILLAGRDTTSCLLSWTL